ncbi:MAG: hypothetical protein QW117_01810 [Candidatus Pacearchaeota archaeon]
MKNKKAQLTLFIIISIFIVALLLIIFWPKVKTIFISSSPEIDFQKCIENDLKKEISLIASNGGSKNPKLYYSYQGDKIEYLCYTNENYKTCVMQQPLLKQHIERELIDELKPKINLCIENIKKSAESQGYKINYIKNSPSIEILQNNVKLSLDTDIVLEKDSKIRITKLESKIPSKIYDLIIISSSILNLEAKYGDTDILTYMIYYPEIKIEKYRQDDGTKIYILTDKNTNEKLVFATRSLNFPGGYGIVV